jgi:hypothetical protein
MKPEISALRLCVAAVAALSFLAAGALLGAAPAQAQGAEQDIPWYMPQPWVHPPRTGPQVQVQPGYYGHNYSGSSYASFSTGCYGNCGYRLPGTVSTGYGLTLWQPTVAYFDPRAYQLVPLVEYPQQAPSPRRAALPKPAVVSTLVPNRPATEMQPKFSLQNGVRIIRPAPLANY